MSVCVSIHLSLHQVCFGMQRGDEGGGEHWRRGRWEGLDLKVLLVLRNINEEASQWGGGGGAGWRGVEGATAGQRETKTRGRVAGCMEMLAGRSADDSSRAF